MSLENTAAAAAELLSRDAALCAARAQVMLDDKADIDAAIRAALGRMGLCLVALDDGAQNPAEFGGLLPALKAAVTVMVYEAPLFNRKSASHLTHAGAAAAAARALHGRQPPGGGAYVLRSISGAAEEPGTGVVWRAVRFEILTQL
jgi:hypothetical protein